MIFKNFKLVGIVLYIFLHFKKFKGYLKKIYLSNVSGLYRLHCEKRLSGNTLNIFQTPNST